MPVALQFKDPEDIHQMRVAGRTVLALLGLLADEGDPADARYEKMTGSMKRSMSLLGRLRDADVMIDEIERRLPAMTPAQRNLLEGWLEEQQAGRRKLRRKVARKLPEIIDAGWKKRMARWQRAKESSSIDETILAGKLDELRDARAQIFRAIGERPPGPVSIDNVELLDLLHRGRIATKKLRYAMESLAPVIETDEAELRHLKTVQEQLGHIQDLRTWSLRLRSAEGDRRIIARILRQWQDEMTETLRQTDLSVDN